VNYQYVKEDKLKNLSTTKNRKNVCRLSDSWFNIEIEFFLVHAVYYSITNYKKILIFCSSSIGNKFFYNGRDDLENFCTTLHPGYRLYYVIFKRQICTTYVKISIKKTSNYYTLWFHHLLTKFWKLNFMSSRQRRVLKG